MLSLANLVDNCYLPLLYYWYEFIYRQTKILTLLPFELKLQMPATDHGKRGYSNSLARN